VSLNPSHASNFSTSGSKKLTRRPHSQGKSCAVTADSYKGVDPSLNIEQVYSVQGLYVYNFKIFFVQDEYETLVFIKGIAQLKRSVDQFGVVEIAQISIPITILGGFQSIRMFIRTLIVMEFMELILTPGIFCQT